MIRTVKSGLLDLLEQHRGETLSGEKIAADLGCSRTAVWKAVNALRAEGYSIEAGQNRGYRLLRDSHKLSAEALRPFLALPDVPYEALMEVGSTNQAAKQMISLEKACHGSFVLAVQQTNGRGRRGKSFYSPPDAGIYLSVILKPEGSLSQNLLLTAEAAVAVYKAVREVTGIETDIKWVNDLYYRNRKICGILTEAVTDFESGDIQWAVVGVGLNIFEVPGGYPAELEGIAGGLYPDLAAAESLNRNRLAAEIVNALLKETATLKLPPEYIERNIVPGQRIVITENGVRREADALGICPDGRLKIREADGTERILAYGEVSLKMLK